MREEDQQRVREIAKTYRWRDVDGNEADFLTADEVKNLTIRSGTLTQEERQIINHHIEVTIKMLESLPWPKHLKNVPEYAGGHHERMDGKGYPRGLTREQMSVQARVMGIADIFEALTAKDRPYKKGKTLTESLHILGKFKLNGHIDPDLFDVFLQKKVYLKYAEQFLDPEQIDEVDDSRGSWVRVAVTNCVRYCRVLGMRVAVCMLSQPLEVRLERVCEHRKLVRDCGWRNKTCF